MDPAAAGYSFEAAQERELEEHEDDDAPLLTAEEEMQYQRALWVNRLLKEQLATQTQGLSIKEIEEAQGQIQARMREAQRLEAWSQGAGEPLLRGSGQRGSTVASQLRSQWSKSSPRRTPVVRAHSEVNRRRRDEKIRQENSSFLRRLENVKSSFTPRICPPTQIRKLSPCSRLLGGLSRDGT